MEDLQPAGIDAGEARWRELCCGGLRGRDVVLLARDVAQLTPLLVNCPWRISAEVQLDAAPCVIVHLLPGLDSDAPPSEQFQRLASLPVCVAEPGLVLKPGWLHVVSSPELGLQHRRFQIRPLGHGSRWAGSVALDQWLDCLAQDLRERALVLWLDPLWAPPEGLRRILSAGGEVFRLRSRHGDGETGLRCGHELSMDALQPAVERGALLGDAAMEVAAAGVQRGTDALARVPMPTAEPVLECLQQALILLDAQLCVRWFNAQATRYFHLLPEDLGCPLTHVSTSLVVDDLGAVLQRVLQQALPHEQRIDHRNGRSDWLRLHHWAGADGQRGVLLSLIDLSALPHLSSPPRVGEPDLAHFAYIVSHDLQEPVRMIVSFAELLQRRHAGRQPMDEDAERFMQLIRDGGQRVRSMLDAMLAYSRIDNRGGEVAGVALDDVVAEAMQRWRPELDRDGSCCESKTLPWVRGDRVQLHWLFHELFANAIKFRREQALRIDVGAEPEAGGFWRLRVADNGSGIPQERAEQAFVMFKRLHARPELPGVGAGLSTVARIVHRHGGDIRVEPGIDGGCCISFTLPADDGGDRDALASAAVAQPTPPIDRRPRVQRTGSGKLESVVPDHVVDA